MSDPDHDYDPYVICEGISFTKIRGLTPLQSQRLNRLASKLGYFSHCQHDLAMGALVAEVLGPVDGPEEMNDLYTGSIERMVTGVASMRPVL